MVSQDQGIILFPIINDPDVILLLALKDKEPIPLQILKDKEAALLRVLRTLRTPRLEVAVAGEEAEVVGAVEVEVILDLEESGDPGTVMILEDQAMEGVVVAV